MIKEYQVRIAIALLSIGLLSTDTLLADSARLQYSTSYRPSCYQVESIGDQFVYPLDINNQGDIAAVRGGSPENSTMLLIRGNETIELGAGFPNALNDDGTVVGYRNDPYNQRIGVIHELDGTESLIRGYGGDINLYDINNQGMIVGGEESFNYNSGERCDRPLFIQKNSTSDYQSRQLDSFTCQSYHQGSMNVVIGNGNHFVTQSEAAGQTSSYLLNLLHIPNGLDLQSFSGYGGRTHVYGISPSGLAVGTATSSDYGDLRPVLWLNGQINQLVYSEQGMQAKGYANAINSREQVVGTAWFYDNHDSRFGFVYKNGQHQRIDSRLCAGQEGITITDAQALNDNGNIVGAARFGFDDQPVAVRIRFVPATAQRPDQLILPEGELRLP